jgi:hypothetical protein
MADGKVIDHLRPAKWFFHSHESEPTTEVAIRRGAAEDLYITLGNYDLAEGNATFKLVVNPMVEWIWFEFMLLGIGTGICLVPDAVLERTSAGVTVGPDRQPGAAGQAGAAGMILWLTLGASSLVRATRPTRLGAGRDGSSSSNAERDARAARAGHAPNEGRSLLEEATRSKGPSLSASEP